MIRCKKCGDLFEPTGKKNVFCSNKCRQKDYRERVNELLAAAKAMKIESVKIIKDEGNKPVAKFVLNMPSKKSKELSPFENYRNKKLGIKGGKQ